MTFLAEHLTCHGRRQQTSEFEIHPVKNGKSGLKIEISAGHTPCSKANTRAISWLSSLGIIAAPQSVLP
jgi:hypothetical protein